MKGWASAALLRIIGQRDPSYGNAGVLHALHADRLDALVFATDDETPADPTCANLVVPRPRPQSTDLCAGCDWAEPAATRL